MSSKKKVALQGVQPKLRFPEFRDAEGWKVKPLGALFTIGNGRDYKHLDKGDIPVYGTGGYMLSVDDYLYDGESVCIGRKGTIDKPVFLTGKFWTVDTLFYTHSFKNCLPKFIFSIFQNIEWKEHNEAGGVPSLSKANIEKIKAAIPKPKEQQKIADCLSSLDELIAAEDKKLDALQQHKEGLMQELFPAEGETLPKRRFPEFQNAPEWEETLLGEVCKFVRGPFGGALKKEIFVKEGYAVYEQMHAIHQDFKSFRYYIDKDKFNELKRFSVSPRDLIMSCSGTMGKFAIVPDNAKQGVINQALLKLSVKKNYNLQFIKEILELPNNQEQLLSQAGGGAIKNVASVDQIKGIKFYVPIEDEQQRIADFLTTIDEVIITQSQKLDALRDHKNGLMQQLFPTLSEVQE
jgi:type I restriction enzyme, S subunit